MTMAQGLRVLLVEDSKVLTERLTEAIRQIPDVELIGTADTEAAALAAVKRDAIDVIILDLHLKQGTGFGVMRALATTQLKPRNAFPGQGARLRPPSGSAARDLRSARRQALIRVHGSVLHAAPAGGCPRAR
jgi:CheY-like chemotaxis protein